MFIAKFDTTNDAFDTDNAECARILRDIADKLENGIDASHYLTIFDVNGNDVGRWKLD